MIKFFKSDELIQEYYGTASSITEMFSPIKEILKKEDFSEYSFVVKDEKISLKDCFVLLVNIKHSSSIHVILDSKINKDELIQKITELKKIKIKDMETSKNKTSALFEILRDYNPYFVIYNAKHEYQLYESEVFELLNQAKIHDFNLLYYHVREELLEEEEEVKVEKVKKEKPVKENGEESKIKVFFGKIGNWFKKLKPDAKFILKNKFHYVFLMVAIFLFGFAFSIGLGNAFIGKGISALFFVFSLLGGFLNTIVFFDYFKKNKLLHRYTIYSVLADVIGIGLAIIGAVIFYNLDKSGIPSAIGFGPLAGIVVGASFFIIAATIPLAYFIRQLKNKKSRA